MLTLIRKLLSKLLLKPEQWLYHKLDVRHRSRATIEEIKNTQEWLNLDIKVKQRPDGGKSSY